MLNRPVIDSDNGIVYNLEKISCALRSGGLRQVYFYCVDISEFMVNKLADRGSLSSHGIVTNVQDFIVNVAKGLGV